MRVKALYCIDYMFVDSIRVVTREEIDADMPRRLDRHLSQRLLVFGIGLTVGLPDVDIRSQCTTHIAMAQHPGKELVVEVDHHLAGTAAFGQFDRAAAA